METVALLEFDLKYGPTIVQSSGEIDIPQKIVNWALQSLPDASYTTGTMDGYFVGAVKFALRDPSTEARGGRRSFSFLLVSDEEIQGFQKNAKKILEWVHARIDGLPRQVERLEELLRQLVEQDPIMLADPAELAPEAIPLESAPKPNEVPATPIDLAELAPEAIPRKSVPKPNGNCPCETVTVKSIQTQPQSPINYSPHVVFEETKIPLSSFVVCQWVDTTEQVEVRLQVGRPLSKRHLRILTMFSLGCEKERETLKLSFGQFIVRRINENVALIGQTDTKNFVEEVPEFFDVLGDVLKHFPQQVTFFLNLYRKNRSVYLSYGKTTPTNHWVVRERIGESYLKGLDQLISLMDGSLSLKKMADTLRSDYSFLEILYRIVLLNDLGMVEIRAK